MNYTKEKIRCDMLMRKYYNPKRYRKCFIEHLKLASKGCPQAQCQVGYFYLYGIGCEIDYDKAFYFTKKAAYSGDKDGEYNLGYFYEHGIGTEKDKYTADYWYAKSAIQGQKEAIKKCDKEMIVYENRELI